MAISFSSFVDHLVRAGASRGIDISPKVQGYAHSGPVSLHENLWGLQQLRLREIRQIAFANSLLQFSLLILTCQLSAGNYGLMEHPACPDRKCDRQPPSVWILPCVPAFAATLIGQFGHAPARPIRREVAKTDYVFGYRTAWSLHYYGTCTETFYHGDYMYLQHSGWAKLQSGGYATAPLKRYPKGLCRAISRMIQVAGGTAATTAPSSNDGLQQAVDALQTGYDCVHDNLGRWR